MSKLIEGICLTPLKKIGDERGMVMHMIRSDSPTFEKFGEVYFSLTHPGIIKGWKKHLEMKQNFAVPVGEIQFVIYDDREKSPTFGVANTFNLSLDKYQLLTVPPLLWYSFKAVSPVAAIIANCASIAHRADEVIFKEIGTSDIPYLWQE